MTQTTFLFMSPLATIQKQISAVVDEALTYEYPVSVHTACAAVHLSLDICAGRKYACQQDIDDILCTLRTTGVKK